MQELSALLKGTWVRGLRVSGDQSQRASVGSGFPADLAVIGSALSMLQQLQHQRARVAAERQLSRTRAGCWDVAKLRNCVFFPGSALERPEASLLETFANV